MKALNRTTAVAALLIAGSAALTAQVATDPFPEVDIHQYADNMTIMGQVRMDGRILGNETVVAVYHADEIRGKDTPFDKADYHNVFYFNVFGEATDEPLHFKVLAEGRLIEVDQGLTYAVNAEVGDIGNWYFIDLPAPIVTPTDADGWTTAFLPFNAEIPEGVTAYVVTGIEDDQLLTEQVEGNIVPANTPVVVHSADAEAVEWLARVAGAEVADASVLTGTSETERIKQRSVLTLGLGGDDGQTIGFWRNTSTTIPANTAYIANPEKGVEGYPLNLKTGGDDTPTAIRSTHTAAQSAPLFDLQGRPSKGVRPGIYVSGNRKIAIR